MPPALSSSTTTPTHHASSPGMGRRRFLQKALLAGAALAAPRWSFGITSAKPKGPNVLFIPVDDLRPQMGCYGVKDIHTPNLDGLAADGCLFERAYCQQSVCSPSRTSLMTGLRPDNTRVYDLHTHFRDTIPNAVTLPEYFKQNGYHTEAIGKIYHGPLDDPQSWSVPWDRSGKRPAQKVAREGDYTSPEAMKIVRERRQELRAAGKKAGGWIPGPAYDIQDVSDEQTGDGSLATAGVDRLRALSQNPDQPFFLAVGFRKPHLPFTAPRKYWDLYDPDSIKLDPHADGFQNIPDVALHNWGELRAYAGIPPTGPLDEQTARTLIRGYYACTSFVDAQVGKLLDTLKELKLWDNTIIALWGDHGYHLGDHGLWCKHTNFEYATHAPLIIRDPQASGSRRINGLCEFVDIYPTLCDLAGLSLPTNLQGVSLEESVHEGRQVIKDAAFSQYPRPQNVMGYSMRTNDYRYTVWDDRKTGKQVAQELYNEAEDPYEMKNLAEEPASQPTVKKLSGMLNRMSPEVFSARIVAA